MHGYRHKQAQVRPAPRLGAKSTKWFTLELARFAAGCRMQLAARMTHRKSRAVTHMEAVPMWFQCKPSSGFGPCTCQVSAPARTHQSGDAHSINFSEMSELTTVVLFAWNSSAARDTAEAWEGVGRRHIEMWAPFWRLAWGGSGHSAHTLRGCPSSHHLKATSAQRRNRN